LAAQFAAEATLRRVHAAQKDDDMPPIEAILAPLEAELKLSRQEVILVFSCSLFVFVQMPFLGFCYICKYFTPLVTLDHLTTLFYFFTYFLRTKCMTS
jgi:hypothetical protein